MAVLDGHHDAGDPTDPVGSALGKIMRALPEPVAAQAEAVRRTTAPAPDRAAARPDPGDHDRARAGLLGPPTGAARLPLRGRVGVGHRGRPVGGRRPPRPVVPAVPVARRRRPAGLPDRPGPRASRCSTTPSSRPPTSTRSPCSRSISPSAGSTTSRSSSTPRSTPWRRALPRALGRLEPVDAGDHPAGRQHQQPVVVRRAARRRSRRRSGSSAVPRAAARPHARSGDELAAAEPPARTPTPSPPPRPTARRSGPPAGRRVLADAAVDGLAEQVGVAGVPAVLLDQVADEPAQAGVAALVGAGHATGWSSPPSARAAASRARDRSTAPSHSA